MLKFNVGDRVRDYRFNHDFYGTVVSVDTKANMLVVQKIGGNRDGCNYGVPMYLMENLSRKENSDG